MKKIRGVQEAAGLVNRLNKMCATVTKYSNSVKRGDKRKGIHAMNIESKCQMIWTGRKKSQKFKKVKTRGMRALLIDMISGAGAIFDWEFRGT
jgi:hypothetical protein